MADVNVPWKLYYKAVEESIYYIEQRSLGKIKSLKTEWKQFNKIGMNGIEWGSLYVLASRPGIGKTLLVQSISRQVQEKNVFQDFYVLHFQFEMTGKNFAARELSSANNLDLRYLLSAKDDGMEDLSASDLEKIKTYATAQRTRKEFVVDTPMTVEQMRIIIDSFSKYIQKPFMVTLDHTLLVKQSGQESSRQVTLQNLSTMMVDTKNKYPLSWIVLTQLNRTIDEAERQMPGKLSNYPSEADVYGSKIKEIGPIIYFLSK